MGASERAPALRSAWLAGAGEAGRSRGRPPLLVPRPTLCFACVGAGGGGSSSTGIIIGVVVGCVVVGK